LEHETGLDFQRAKWTLILLGQTDWIEGATRVQKYAFLGAMTIKGIIDKGFYHDWVPSKYGPFSPNLAEDLTALVKSGLVGKYPVKNEFGYPVDRFALTDSGREKLRGVEKESDQYWDKLKEIVLQYKEKSLMDLLHDVYVQFPSFAYSSSIRPQIAKKKYESDSYLSKEFDESSD
jgi:uncharacterized protein YwgA